MVNKREAINFIIYISDKRISSFFISLILSLFFYLYIFFFPNRFCFNFVISEQNVHIFSILDISERNFFSRWGGGGGVHVHPVHPPVRTRLGNLNPFSIGKLSTSIFSLQYQYKICCFVVRV